MQNIFTRVSLIAGLTALLSIASLAQTNAPQRGDEGGGDRQGRMQRREGRMRGERGRGVGGGREMMDRRIMRRLNLTDAQRDGLREIEARYAENFKAQRVEMRRLIELHEQGATLTPEQKQRAQQLRGELRNSADKMRDELLALLTPEQRDELKRMREEGQARRRQRREAFGTLPDNE